MQVELVMFKADGQRRTFVLRKDVTVVGRATECDFQIPLAMVSRRHCQLAIKNDAVLLRDLGSSNGTFVNEHRVQEAQLAAGDKLTIGPVTFTVVVDGVPSEIEPIPTSAAGAGVLELDHGTVDVETERNADSGVKAPAAAQTPAPGEDVEEVEEVQEITDLDEVHEVHELTHPGPVAEEHDEPAPTTDDPLAALEAMTRPPKKN